MSNITKVNIRNVSELGVWVFAEICASKEY